MVGVEGGTPLAQRHITAKLILRSMRLSTSGWCFCPSSRRISAALLEAGVLEVDVQLVVELAPLEVLRVLRPELPLKGAGDKAVKAPLEQHLLVEPS